MKVESITLRRWNSSRYQVTVWADGVVRWDAESGPRLGAWQGWADSTWTSTLAEMASVLPKSAATPNSDASLVIETPKRRIEHSLGGAAEHPEVWALGMLVDGICAHIRWLPFDVTGADDLAVFGGGQALTFRGSGANADALAVPDAMLVLAGSFASPTTSPTLENNYTEIRESLIEDGALTLVDDAFVMTRHLVYESPSASASVLAGSNTNGRRAWRDPMGRTWAELFVQ